MWTIDVGDGILNRTCETYRQVLLGLVRVVVHVRASTKKRKDKETHTKEVQTTTISE